MKRSLHVGDVVSILFPSGVDSSWDWKCVAVAEQTAEVTLQSPGGRREVHSLPVIRAWVRSGRVQIIPFGAKRKES